MTNKGLKINNTNKWILAAISCFAIQANSETFTNRTKNGTVIISTVSLPKPTAGVMHIPPPPMPPGMKVNIPPSRTKKPSSVMAGAAIVKNETVLTLDAIFKTNSNCINLFGPLPKGTNRVNKTQKFKVASYSTNAFTNIVTITTTNRYVFYGDEPIYSRITNVKATQLANYDCSIIYGGDVVFQLFGVAGDFWVSPTQREVEIQWVNPVAGDFDRVFFGSLNYHRGD